MSAECTDAFSLWCIALSFSWCLVLEWLLRSKQMELMMLIVNHSTDMILIADQMYLQDTDLWMNLIIVFLSVCIVIKYRVVLTC